MTTTLPTAARASVRTGVRILGAGALALGLLTTAPTLDAASAAPASKAQTKKHDAKKHQGKKNHGPKRSPGARMVARAMSVAVAQKGDPYAYGAAGPSRFDCSGLTSYSFKRAGFKAIPRTSSAQAHFANRITRARMKRGDLVFFTNRGRVYHVGIFAGRVNGRPQVLHAPYSGTRVRTERIWTNSWYPGTLRFR